MTHRGLPARKDGLDITVWASTHGEHRSRAPSLSGQLGVTDGINPSMNPMQPSGSHASANCLFRETETAQLAQRDHAVLPRGDLGKHRVGVGDFPALHG